MPVVVLRDLLVLLELLQHLQRVAPVVADGHPIVFGNLLDVLDQLLPALLREGGTGTRMILPSFCGLKPQVRRVDGPLDRVSAALSYG
jgi:hypothetical protein